MKSPPHTAPRVACLSLALAALSSGAVHAQSASPGARIELAPVVVTEGQDPIQSRFDATPAAVTRIDRVTAAREGEPIAPTVSQALERAPGVIVQEFFGGNDQPRIQIRGSGLQQNPSERGLLILQDGMPVNRADGSYVVGLAAPGQADAIEIFRGAAGNRLGANMLGGAVNFISPSGATAPGGEISAGLGSFGRHDLSARYGFDGEQMNGLLRLEHSGQDGYRDYNSSRRTVLGGNLSLRVGRAHARLFLNHTDLAFDVAGPLPWSALEANPRQNHTGPILVAGTATNPGPNVLRDRPRRATTQTLAGLRVTLEQDRHLFDAGLSLSSTDDSFRFPISAGQRDIESRDATLTARYALLGDQVLPRFEAGVSYATGRADRNSFHNLSGSAGPAFGRNRLNADTFSAFAGGNLPFGAFTLSPQIAFSHASRDNRDRWSEPTRPTVAYSPASPTTPLPAGAVPAGSTDYTRSYSGASPSLALSWRPVADQLGWISLTRGFEAPTHDDLLGTVNGTPNSGPGRPQPPNAALAAAAFATPDLKAQRSTTFEIGWRSVARTHGWDATAYHSRVKNELLSLRDLSGAAIASMNADRTRHTGLELGLWGPLAERLDARLSWTWQDFRFHDDPVRGNRRIGGAPRHLISVSMNWQATDRLSLNGAVRWVPDATPVDNMNTVFNRRYALVHLGARYRITPTFTVLARVDNLFDKRYASSTLVVDQATMQQAVFIPGTGRAAYLGARMNF